MPQTSRLLIVGASTRAAAQSAARAGIKPICADLFLDEDLRAVADVLPIARYPQSLPEDVGSTHSCPWMYTGAVENYPPVVAEMSAQRPLWGCDAESLVHVRDPVTVRKMLLDSDLPALAVRTSTDPPPTNGRWLLKPVRGANGCGIRIWSESSARTTDLSDVYYFQAKRLGKPVSALYLARANATSLIGIAQQSIGLRNAPQFSFCGALAPTQTTVQATSVIKRIGTVLARECDLRGLFGCDFVFDGKTAWLTEVNPRYTASAELFEYALGVPLVDWHCRACGSFDDKHIRESDGEWQRDIESAITQNAPRYAAKMILYSDRDIETPCLDRFTDWNPPGATPAIADIPASRTRIARGQPICTLLAEAPERSTCIQQLQDRVRAVAACVMQECRDHYQTGFA